MHRGRLEQRLDANGRRGVSWSPANISRVTAEVELVYDKNIAARCMRSSDKYERLAAVAFHLLTEETAVHDLRLRGESGVKHQIDAVVGPAEKRILIECKDYDKNVRLPLVRDFFGVVEDLTPDEAFIVTTEGYSPQAQTYAEAKGIRLALLRPPRDRDLDGLVQRIVLGMDATTRLGDPRIEWRVSAEDWAEVADIQGHLGATEVDELSVAFPDGSVVGFREIWEPIEGNIPLGSNGVVAGEHSFDDKAQLNLPGYGALLVTGFAWEVEMSTFRAFDIEVGLGIGGLVAELALLSIDGQIHRIFTNHQLAEFDFSARGDLKRTSGERSRETGG